MDDQKTLYPTVTKFFTETPWALLQSTYETMAEIIRLRATGGHLSPIEISARVDAAAPRRGAAAPKPPAVAVIPLYGVIMAKASLFSQMSGAQSLADFRAALQAAADDQRVTAIVLDVDSPGGSTDMVPETAAMVREISKAKHVVAVASTMAASAAYWIASQASELVVTTSGAVGSVGVYCAHEDWSKALATTGVDVTLIHAGQYKVDGNKYEPLSDDARSYLQAWVDDVYTMFVDDVAVGRGVSTETVIGDYGGGRLMQASAAVAAGMADRVDTLDATIARLLGGRPTSTSPVALGDEPRPEGGDAAATLAEMEDRLRSLNHGFNTTSLKEATP